MSGLTSMAERIDILVNFVHIFSNLYVRVPNARFNC